MCTAAWFNCLQQLPVAYVYMESSIQASSTAAAGPESVCQPPLRIGAGGAYVKSILERTVNGCTNQAHHTEAYTYGFVWTRTRRDSFTYPLCEAVHGRRLACMCMLADHTGTQCGTSHDSYHHMLTFVLRTLHCARHTPGSYSLGTTHYPHRQK